MKLKRGRKLLILGLCILILVLVCVVNIPFLYRIMIIDNPNIVNTDEVAFSTAQTYTTKVILLYTGLFGNREWTHVPLSEVDNYTKLHSCAFRNCRVTYDRDEKDTADALLFHADNLLSEHVMSAKSLRELSANHRKPYQRWIFLTHETPIFRPSFAAFDGLFNWTMTYMVDSDIFFPYFYYQKYREEIHPPPNYAEGKTGLVAWMVSHCGLLREKYVLELEKYISIHVYGNCGRNHHGNKGRLQGDPQDTLGKYKFYLAFENSFCKDYVTEKYWRNGISFGVVPIVMGANYNSMNAIPGSYINTKDFKNPRELAKYLHYLNGNDTAYNEYFSWKQHFKVNNGLNLICQICETLEKWKDRKKIIQLSQFWNSSRVCSGYEESVKQSLKSLL